MTPQLPKQTIERIEREANNTFFEPSQYVCYETGATREALLVLPVIEAARKAALAYINLEDPRETMMDLWAQLKAYEAKGAKDV